MSKHPVLRQGAARDAETITRYYASEGAQLALGFAEALQLAYTAIGDYPGIGSLRFAASLGVPDLRAYRLKRFPYLLFYVDRDAHIEIWRLLHVMRDIPGAFPED